MKLLSFTKKLALPIFILLLSAVTLAGSGLADEDPSHEKWKQWIGKKVNVMYACCGESSCMLIRGAKLKDVTDKAIVVIVKGSPFLIPKYMIKRLELSKY